MASQEDDPFDFLQELQFLFDVNAVNGDNRENVIETIREKIDAWKSVPLNIKYLGQSKAGKSTLINVLRGVTDADNPDAAAVGDIETTMVPAAYRDPVHPNTIMHWDSRGTATPGFQKENITFEDYDVFVLVTGTTFLADDKWMAQQAQKLNKKFLIVRTKVVEDYLRIPRVYRNRPKCEKKQKELPVEIRGNIEKNLGDLYEEDNVFLIDCLYRSPEYDVINEFGAFQERLIAVVEPEKRERLVRSMGPSSKMIIQKKIAALRNEVRFVALKAAVCGAFPVFGTPGDLSQLLLSVQQYYEELEIDFESLERKAEMCGIETSQLSNIVDTSLPPLNTEQGLCDFAESVSYVQVALKVKSFFEFINQPANSPPAVAAIVSAGAKFIKDNGKGPKGWMDLAITITSTVSFALTAFLSARTVCNKVLDLLEPVAIDVLNEVIREEAKYL